MQKTPECFWGLLYIQTYDKVSVMKTEDLYKKIAQEIIMSTDVFEWAEKKGMEFQMEIMENFDRIQKVLKSDIPQEKLECFLEVLDMIRENAQRECCLRDEN